MGNIFVREELKDIPREEIIGNEKYRTMIIEDIVDELTRPVLKRSSLYRLLMKYKPEVVVDCVNSATGIAYQDIFQVSRELIKQIQKARAARESNAPLDFELLDATERLLCTLYIPQLIRHVQIMYRSMQDAGTKIYVKIGTSGTGGMGLNIPYTHSEERPSRVLLSKSAVAGAHTLLLFLMGRTPDAPITKEIKPTAAIAWKRIAYGEIRKRGKPVRLWIARSKHPVELKRTLKLRMNGTAQPTGKTLRSVFIDTGENGFFSRGEFEAISTPGQMEFVTPEEIAENAVFEIKAGNTGHDIINALDNATLSPTYRAGFMFNSALDHDEEPRARSTASIRWRSRCSVRRASPSCCTKRICSSSASGTSAPSPPHSPQDVEPAALRTPAERSGSPLPDHLHRHPDPAARRQIAPPRAEPIKIPPYRGEDELPISPESIDRWAHDGWVDLRESNMKLWRDRFNGDHPHGGTPARGGDQLAHDAQPGLLGEPHGDRPGKDLRLDLHVRGKRKADESVTTDEHRC